MTHCKAITNKNTNCQAYHMKGSDYCFTHNPEMRAAHYRATRAGGSVRKIDRIARLRKVHALKHRTAYNLLKTSENYIHGVKR